ncbi:MAG TPA: AmmeMemoRadiSam system protein A [Verrucomicrobiae bacterium]|nr:AmmeMemoRadiSam system protein A [Verrucomicrobiae bacterium]
MNEPPINEVDQNKLLRWVRATIDAAVHGRPAFQPDNAEISEPLRSPHGAFVTLKKGDDLRGCIGKMDFEEPLWKNALAAATASALEDPRFPPVKPGELPDLSIEISILNPPEDLPQAELFDVTKHGIIIEKGWRHGLFLPKVAAEQGWDATKTLEMVCWKAGLPADAWRDPAARLKVFTAFEFGEPEGEGDPRHEKPT